MQRKTLTSAINLSAAAAFSGSVLNPESYSAGATGTILIWLITCAVPLFFVFTYPRYLFEPSSPPKRRKYAAVLHGLGAVTATVLFPVLALPVWEIRLGGDDLIPIFFVVLIVFSMFLVTALFLLFRNKSSLAALASCLFWPYWLLLAVENVDRFRGTPLEAVFYFGWFVTPVFFAFAAGAVAYRSTFAHAAALMGLVCTPWLYWTTLRNTPLGNVWLMFNVPNNELYGYDVRWSAGLAVVSVGMVVLVVATAGLRLLPSRWQFRGAPVGERTWPAVAGSVLFLAVWFSQSVMPYRIPGAVDYARWPVLRILHVEKRGLQFHESCVSVWEGVGHSLEVSFSGNDRRLFQYRFRERSASGQLSEPLTERVRTAIQSSDGTKQKPDPVQSLREWNADGWYFSSKRAALKVYSTAKGAAPPQEIVELFNELEKVPRSQETQSERKDVCLGFCYDPLSELGYLYANHRCYNDGHGLVCR
jgi:hypothetical protein